MRFLAVVLLVACHQDAPPAKPGTPVAPPIDATVAVTADAARPRLFDDSEIAGLESGFLAVLDANARRSCPGPRVLGAVASGPSAPEIAAMVDATGELAACFARADFKATDVAKPELVALDHDCGKLVEASVRHAAALDGGCSPYQIGVRPDPESMEPILRLASLIGLHAHLLAPKDPVKALAVALDGLRVAQDILRGHVGALVAVRAAIGIRTIAQEIDAILDTAKLSRAQLVDVELALDRLIEAQPPFADILAGELEDSQLNIGMAEMEDASWTPPGGWNEASRVRPAPGGKHVIDPRDQGAADFIGAARNKVAMSAACPAISLKACRDGLAALPDSKLLKDPPELYADFAAATAKGDLAAVRGPIREGIIDVATLLGRPAFATFIEKYGLTLSWLAELRIHAELAHTKRCPSEATLAKTPFAELAAPPNLGEPMVLHASKNTVEISGLFVTEPWKLHCR